MIANTNYSLLYIAPFTNGARTSATLNSGTGMALDSGGNIYIADSYNYVIRKVDASSGIVSTFAGTQGTSALHTLATNGDGGPATSTSFSDIIGVVVDDAQMYVVDVNNSWIRNISLTTNIITTLAGAGTYGDVDATGTNAYFDTPFFCALAGSSGILIVTDTFNNKIKSIVTSTQVVTTLSGTVPFPLGVWVDSSLVIYVSGNTNVLYSKPLSSGSFTAIAGSSTGSFVDGIGTSALFNNILALSGDSSGYLYIADFDNHRLRKMDTTTLVVTTLAGNGTASSTGDDGYATSATFNGPIASAVDTNGNIYLLENVGQRVR